VSGDRENDLQALIDRIANGESIDLDGIPQALRNTPQVQRLLAIARVTQVLDRNQGGVAPAAPAETIIGPWRLLHLLGSGGMGEVWLGERSDGVVEHRVAIKRVRAHGHRFHERLLSERRLLARLEHPNIARFIDAGVDGGGAPWLAMEYVEGMPITEWCAARSLPVRARLQLFQKVCAAVEHAHRHLIVHRDLKPSNVMVNGDGEPKLLDFGIAKLLDGSEGETTVGALTPAYAAPEQLRGEEVSTATDVYVLGLLLYRILSGALPETRTSGQLAAVLARISEEETQRPSASARAAGAALPYPASVLSGDLDAIVAQAIRALPQARYGSVAELSADIGRYLDARPIRARAPSRWYRFSRFARRNRAALALGSLAALALIAGTVISLQQARRAEREAQTARRELARAERVSEFLGSLYREHDPLSRDTLSARPPAVLVAEAIARVEGELSDDPWSQAQLLRVLGEAQLNLSQLDAAHETLELAASKILSGGIDSSKLLLSAEIDGLRAAVARRGLRNEDAEQLFKQALAQASAAAGVDSAAVGRINALSATTLLALSRFKDARAVAESAHDVLTKKLGSNHPETISALVSLGAVQEQLREDASALVNLRAAVATIEQRFSRSDARLIRPLLLLGEVLRRERDFDDGRIALDRGADIARRQLGDRNVLLADVLITRSRMESEAGRAIAAIAALDAAEHALPESEINTRAQLLATRGKIWIELADGKRAEPDLREALRLRQETGGLQSGIAWFSQADLGWALALQGRFDEAHALVSEAEQKLSALLGPEAYQNALIAVRRGVVFELQHDWRNAARYFRESIRIEEQVYGREHYLHFSWSLALAKSLSHLSDGRDEAIHITDRLIKDWRGKPETAAEYAQLMLLRCELHTAEGEAQAAKKLATETLAKPDLVATPEQRAALRRFVSGK
jgi:eukaryotic-like serine/threonine-protein kinase